MTFVKWLIALFAFFSLAATAPRTSAQEPHKPLLVGSHQIDHVFIIVLENKGFNETFGEHSEASYLAKELPSKGVLLKQYFGIGHASLDNYIAMISGMAATKETRGDCTRFADFVVDTSNKKYPDGKDEDGQLYGTGCIYPPDILSLANQLQGAHKSWRGYMEDMGNNPSRERQTCGHPTIGELDNTQKAVVGDQYATRHDPFMYFHSIIDHQADCDMHVVNLELLRGDLRSIATTPNLSFITPNLCNDGHDDVCIDGRPGGLAAADKFLREWVPLIMNSPAYKDNGLLIVTFDEADFDDVRNMPDGRTIYTENGESCCNERPGPNLGTFPQSNRSGMTIYRENNFGGDRMGAVLLSPLLVPGNVSNIPFNHYSLLKTVEDLFGLDYLGYAGQKGLVGFFGCVESDVAIKDDPNAGRCKAK